MDATHEDADNGDDVDFDKDFEDDANVCMSVYACMCVKMRSVVGGSS